MKRKKYTYKDCIYFSDRTKEVCIDKKDHAESCTRYHMDYCHGNSCYFLQSLNKYKLEMGFYTEPINEYFDD